MNNNHIGYYKISIIKMSLLNKLDLSFLEKRGDFLIQGSDNDTEYNKGLKERSQSFLRVNDFDFGKEKIVKDMDEEEFLKSIEAHDFNEATLFEKISSVNININFRSMMSNVYTNKHNPNLKILVLFLPSDKGKNGTIGKEIIRKFITLLLKLDCLEGLLISHKDLSSCAKEQIANCNINPGSCENIYKITSYTDDTFVDLVNHSFVPKIVKIFRGEEEVAKFAEENNVRPKDLMKLPKLRQDDAMVKFFRGNYGDIFKLVRQNINDKSLLKDQIIFRIVTTGVQKKK